MLEDATGGSSSASSQVEWVGWGLSRLANALKFINVDASSVHGNVRIETIFLSAGGEWRLGGFELLTSTKEEAGIFYTMGNILPDSSRIFPPEAKQGGTQALKGMPAHMADSYGLALAAFEAYNGTLPPTTSVPPQGKVPANIYAMLKKMLTPNAKTRASTTQFLESGIAEGGYFQTNRLVQVAAGIDNFMLASEPERAFVMKRVASIAHLIISETDRYFLAGSWRRLQNHFQRHSFNTKFYQSCLTRFRIPRILKASRQHLSKGRS